MNEDSERELSALMDGELDPARSAALCDIACGDAGLCGLWERWHLIGQSMRGEPISAEARGTARRVREGLGREPVPIDSPPRRPFSASIPFGGAALAAAAALLAVLAVPALFEGLSGPPVGQAPRLAESRPAAALAPSWHLDRPELASRLDLFLVAHQEAAPSAGVKGMLHYANLVGYEGRR